MISHSNIFKRYGLFVYIFKSIYFCARINENMFKMRIFDFLIIHTSEKASLKKKQMAFKMCIIIFYTSYKFV